MDMHVPAYTQNILVLKTLSLIFKRVKHGFGYTPMIIKKTFESQINLTIFFK